MYKCSISSSPSTPGHYWTRLTSLRCMPKGAVRAGQDSNQGEIYVGMARYNGMTLPAKVIPSRGCAYVSYGGVEHAVHDVDILCERTLKWVHSSNGSIPVGAVEAGRDGGGERLYVGRAHHANTLTVGKIHPSHRCLYIPYNGTEHRYSTYEILVYD